MKEFGIGSTNDALIYIFFLDSHYLSAWYCIIIVRRNSVLVTHGSKRVKKHTLNFDFVLSGSWVHCLTQKILLQPSNVILEAKWTLRKNVTFGRETNSLEPTLTFYTITSVCIFSILFSMHFFRCLQGEFVWQSKASIIGDHFLYFWWPLYLTWWVILRRY